MKKILLLFKRVYSCICTFIFKRMIRSYGYKLGVNSLSICSSKASVDIGNYANFNGVRIIGQGG